MSDTAIDTETPDAAPSLDDFLAEFEQGAEAAPETEPAQPDAPADHAESDEAARRAFEERAGALLDSFEEKARQDREAEDTAAIDSAIAGAASALSDLKLDFPEDIARSFLFARSQTDPRFMEAFQNRRVDPRAWDKAMAKALTDMDAKYSTRIDRDATDDRAAVTAAVRGSASAPVPDEIDVRAVGKLNDAQFEEWKRSLGK